jgi:MFS family permease
MAAGPVYAAIRMPAGRGALAVCLAMLGYGLLQMYYGLVYAAIQDAVGPAMRGRAMALYFVVTYLGGASWGPLATGRLSDFLARRSGLAAEASRAVGLHDAMYTIPALAVVLAAVLWMAGRQRAAVA